ncbi:MAG: ATP-binding protein [Draconibacterium sp.]
MKLRIKNISTPLIIILSFFLNTSLFAFEQKIDSLRIACLTETDTIKLVDNYNSLAGYFTYSNSDSTLHYAQKAIQLARQANYKKGEGIALFQISYCYDDSGEWNDAIKKLETAISIFKEIKDSSYLVASQLNLGLLYSYGQDLVKGLEYTIKAKNLAEILNNNEYWLIVAYTNIGWYYEYLKEYRSAYRYYMQALEIAEKSDNTDNVAVLTTGLCFVNIQLKKLDEALSNLKRTQEILAQIKDDHIETQVTILFVYYYLEVNELENAQKNLEKAERMIEEQNFERMRGDLAFLQGKLLLKQKKYSDALVRFDKALKLCEKLDRHDLDNDIFTDKTDALVQLGQYKMAFEVQELQHESAKLLQSNKIAQVLGEFESQELQKEEKKQARLQNELNEEKNRSIIFKNRIRLQISAFIAALLAIVVIVLIYFLLHRKKHAASLRNNFETINKQKILLQKNLGQLEENEKKLKELNATKDKFFSIIAHDLKNPFNVLIGISDILRTDVDIKNSKDFETLVEGMFQTATSGYNLLENLLEWSRTQTGNIQFNPQPFYLNKVLSGNEILFREAIKSKNLTINWPSTRKMVVADFNMVNFIFRNLLNNAVKFSYKGNTIDISISVNGKMAECKIQDYGTGMDDDTLQKLFKIEYSIQKDGTANEKGTGLGLILCKEFVEKNGGKIWVNSQPGEGSTFCFSLPLKLD